MSRPEKHRYYLDIAKQVSLRGTCLRRNYGAVIVSSNDTIVSTGYSGSPRGVRNCSDGNSCPRNDAGCKPGEGYELCCSVHAEQNAIIQAAANDMRGATMYVSGFGVAGNTNVDCSPCCLCRRMIINAGIKLVIASEPGGGWKRMHVGDWRVDGSLSAMRPLAP